MSIDLHVHSINSDGTETIEAILESANELQLEAICISDHEYLTKVPKRSDIEIIHGAEISVSWKLLENDNKFGGTHLLVYFLEEDSPLNNKLHELRLNKIQRNYSILDNLKEFGITIEKKDLDDLETKVPGRPHIAELMVKKEYVTNLSEAFAKYLGNGKIDDIDNAIADIFKRYGEWKDVDREAQLDDQVVIDFLGTINGCLLYTSPSPRDKRQSRMAACA